MKNILTTFTIIVILSCHNSNKIEKKAKNNNIDIKTISNTELSKLQKFGIDFFAEGNVPSNWKLQINIDDTVRFIADDGLSLKIGYNQLKKDTINGNKVYSATTKDGDIKIFITNKECTTPIHKEVFTKEVKFSFNSITYNGCGNYLSNNNLHGKWKLEKLGNININTKDYNVAPFCNIDLNKNSITGNDGCNTFGGKIEVQGDRIKFGLLISTQMACGNKSIDQILAQQINNQLVNYYFKESKLYLYLPNDSILVFIKYE